MAAAQGLDFLQSERLRDLRPPLVPNEPVGALLIHKPHRLARVAHVTDEVLPIGVVLGVAVVNCIAPCIDRAVQCPCPHHALTLRLDARIRRGTVLHRQPRLGLNREALRPIGRIACRRSMRCDAAEALQLGPVFAASRTVGTRHVDKPLPVQAEAVFGVVIHRTAHPIGGHGFGAAGDGGQAFDAPAHAHDAVAGLAVVAQGQLRLHAGHAGRHFDGNAVGGGAAGGDGEFTRDLAGHRGLGHRGAPQQAGTRRQNDKQAASKARAQQDIGNHDKPSAGGPSDSDRPQWPFVVMATKPTEGFSSHGRASNKRRILGNEAEIITQSHGRHRIGNQRRISGHQAGP